jgi:hypothetical protein
LFNVYLEEAIKSSKKLEEVRSRGDLLAFADDMLVMSNQRAEVEMIIEELTNLQHRWNLRLNKRKSEILTGEKEEEIKCFSCSDTLDQDDIVWADEEGQIGKEGNDNAWCVSCLPSEKEGESSE